MGNTVVTGWRPAPKLTASPFGIYIPNEPATCPATHPVYPERSRYVPPLPTPPAPAGAWMGGRGGLNGGGGVLCRYEQCLAGIHAVPERVRVGGRSILLESSVMVGSSFVSVYAWAHKHAS